MPIISKVEGKSPRGIAIYAVLFTLLTLGGATMVYPFIIMLSGSVRSRMDENDLDLVPDYFSSTDVLYRKFLETKYDGDITFMGRENQRFPYFFDTTEVPAKVNPAAVADFKAFHDQPDFPRHWQGLGCMMDASKRIAPANLRKIRDDLKEHFHNDLAELGRDLGTNVPLWTSIFVTRLTWCDRRFDLSDSKIYQLYFAMHDTAPLAELEFVNISGYFLELMALPKYGRFDTKAYNKAHNTDLPSYDRFAIPRQAPPADQALLRTEWIDFVRNDLHPTFIVLADTPDDAFRQFLRQKYGDVIAVGQAWGVSLTSFDDIRLPRNEWLSGSRRADYVDFLLEQNPDNYRLIGPEFAWQDFVEKKYGTIDSLNAAHGSAWASFAEVRMPVDQVAYEYVSTHAGALRYEYATRNYRNVLRDMVFQGRAFFNTVVVCAASIVLVLLINPLAAYAMSRFQLPGTYKILLFLMATSAFPGMVVTVPKFLILREFNMLNSYWALIIPFIANGYQIFLLKGFFDSLPKDLYEAATIDGASEMRMFFQITMALSKPILAVVALGAFTHAYTMFLYALIVCPDTDMWTINIWLYQWQQDSTQSGIFASLLIAAVPTMLIFLFAQNIIMRGIVVPTEK